MSPKSFSLFTDDSLSIQTKPMNYPPTIIVVHPKERRSKCTVEPLRTQEHYADEFHFWTWPHQGTESLDNYIRLGIGGELLSENDREKGLLVLDGTWKLTEPMERDYQDIPLRSLPCWQTAYPRTSKIYLDPQSGLATIEAIYVAYTLLHRPTDHLLDDYYWKEEFLDRNRFAMPDEDSTQQSARDEN